MEDVSIVSTHHAILGKGLELQRFCVPEGPGADPCAHQGMSVVRVPPFDTALHSDSSHCPNTLNPTGAQLEKQQNPACGRNLKDGPMQILLFHSPEKASVSFFFQTLLEPR